MCFVLLHPFSTCADAHFEIAPCPVLSHSVFIYPTMHSVILRTSVGQALSSARGGDTTGFQEVCSIAREHTLNQCLRIWWAFQSKPRILREQITGKPNLIWRTREGLPVEVTTRQDLRGWVGGPERAQEREQEGKEGINEYWNSCVPGPLPWSLQGESIGEPEVSFGSGTESCGTPECFFLPQYVSSQLISLLSIM